VTLGGYVAAESVFRARNEVADMGDIFNAIPYPFSPLYSEHEFHASARGSRFSLLAEGDIDSAHRFAAYYESDFLGVGETSNYTESNSWSPRLRQAYLTYDDTDRGFHILAGQAWSLLTPTKVGITPRQENDPLKDGYGNGHALNCTGTPPQPGCRLLGTVTDHFFASVARRRDR